MFFIRNLSAVIISALAIPASIVATFTLMRAMDFTLNNMTLLALTLAVGIVIDDAIVVLENIFRYIEEKHSTPFDAAIEGTREVALAGDGDDAVAGRDLPAGGVHDRVCAPFHLPVRLDDGVLDSGVDAGQLHADADAQLAVPEIADAERDKKTKEHGILPRRRARATRRSLRWTLAHPWTVIAFSVFVFALTFPLNRIVGRTFVPNEDMGEFTVHVDTPQGTSLEGTTEIARGIVKEIGEQEGVANVSYLAGADRYTHFHVFFYLLPIDERTVTQDQVIARIRRILAKHPGANPTVSARNPLWRRRRRRRFVDQRVAARSGHRQALRLLAATPREGARARPAWSTRGPTTATPARRCRWRSIARAPPISASGWRRSAARCA